MANGDGAAGGRYRWPAQLLHWLTAVMVAVLVALAIYMEGLPLGLEKFRLYNLHKSIGLTVLVVVVLRLAWRRHSPPPSLPRSMKGWERRAARTSHGLLYALLLVQPIVGLMHSWAANFPVIVYGVFTLPNPIAPHDGLKETLEAIHGICGWVLVALVCVHVAAALKHHFIDRDEVLVRMLPSGPRRKGGQE